VADFYRGKTIYIITGQAGGAAYDFLARVLANTWSKHIPGNPSFAVENMPGAASLVMVNHLYNRAARDGTVMGMPNNSILLEPRPKALSRDGSTAHFDLAKMSFIGTPTQQPQVLWVWHSVPAQSAEDLKKSKFILGATSAGGDSFLSPTLANSLIGTQFTITTGYQGINEIFVAAERGEVDGGSANYSSLLGNQDLLRDNKMRVLIQFGADRISDLKDVPTAIDLARDEPARQALRVFAMKFKTAYPILLPPEVPSERVKALQDSFDALMNDAQFIVDAKKIGIDIDPVGGEDIRKLLAEIDAVPQDVVDRLAKIINQ
jgi:tripartite-type tricarboxylate transporter receptor subunit TctC